MRIENTNSKSEYAQKSLLHMKNQMMNADIKTNIKFSDKKASEGFVIENGNRNADISPFKKITIQ